ncbi:hypothetical protein SBADM41S_02835 [Streptomyces badius]
MLLKPAMVQLRCGSPWVPTDTVPLPWALYRTPSPSADGAGGTDGEAPENQSGVDTQSLYEDGGGTMAEGSVAVTHTPESGTPTAQTEIPNACSGTIYRTGVLATSSPATWRLGGALRGALRTLPGSRTFLGVLRPRAGFLGTRPRATSRAASASRRTSRNHMKSTNAAKTNHSPV